MWREIASVRLLTAHLAGLELAPSEKCLGFVRGAVFDSFKEFVAEFPNSPH
jgi:hypothetical protein